MIRNCLVTLTLMAASCLVAQEPFSAKVVGVTDGDTIKILTAEKQEIKVRFEGIDAPESKQDFGQKSKQVLSDMVFNKTVSIKPTGTDRYKRMLARVSVDGEDVNVAMVASGMAWHFTRYNKDADLAKAEADARKRKVGVWSHPNPVPPWEWRKRG